MKKNKGDSIENLRASIILRYIISVMFMLVTVVGIQYLLQPDDNSSFFARFISTLTVAMASTFLVYNVFRVKLVLTAFEITYYKLFSRKIFKYSEIKSFRLIETRRGFGGKGVMIIAFDLSDGSREVVTSEVLGGDNIKRLKKILAEHNVCETVDV